MIGPSVAIYGVPSFADVSFTVELAHSGSAPVVVQGFYDGGGQYKARFMPPETGKWEWRTRSSSVATLNNIRGMQRNPS